MAKKWLDSIEKQRRRIDLKERYRQTNKQTNIQTDRVNDKKQQTPSRRGVNTSRQAIRLRAQRKCRCHDNKDRPPGRLPCQALTYPVYLAYKPTYGRFCRKIAKICPNFVAIFCHGNKGRPHDIVHGSIESANPDKPLGANIAGLSVIQAELQVILCKCTFWEVNFVGQGA